MRHLSEDRRRSLLATMYGAAQACGGPTVEQRALLDAVATHLFGLDLEGIAPLDAPAAAEAVVDEDRPLAVGGVITIEMAHHKPTPELLGATEDYLSALGAGEDYRQLVRDQVRQERAAAEADLTRLRTRPRQGTAAMEDPDHDLEARLVRLEHCEPGTVGRSFYDLHRRNGFAWPPDPGLVRHDFHHVFAGYEPVPEGELALQAMLTVVDTDQFPALLASLLLYEAGLVAFPGIEPKEAVLARHGAADLFGEALARGAACSSDFIGLDHLEFADRQLAEVRVELGIPSPSDGPFTLVP